MRHNRRISLRDGQPPQRPHNRMAKINPTIARKGAQAASQLNFKFDYEDGEEYEPEELAAVLHTALAALSESPTFRHMTKACGRKAFKVIFDDTIEEYGSIDPDSREIYISSHTTPEQLISTLAHEVRHAFQYATILNTTEVDRLKRKDFMVWNMLLEADASSTEAQVLAEIQHLKIGPPAREAAKNLPYYRTVHGAFESQVERDPASLRDGRAQLAAFKRYFNTRLVSIYTEGFKEYYADLRKEGGTADLAIPDHAAKALGWHATGGNYLDRDHKLSARTGESLRKDGRFIGQATARKKGRNARMVDISRLPRDMKDEMAQQQPLFRPFRPHGNHGRPLRPF